MPIQPSISRVAAVLLVLAGLPATTGSAEVPVPQVQPSNPPPTLVLQGTIRDFREEV